MNENLCQKIKNEVISKCEERKKFDQEKSSLWKEIQSLEETISDI